MGKNRKKMKHKKRCSYSGKIISTNKEVILVDKAFEYVKKQGYKVVPIKKMQSIEIFATLFICTGALNLL